MKNTHQLVKTLSSAEITSVTNYFKTTAQGKRNLYLQCFNYLTRNKKNAIDEKKIQSLYFGTVSPNAFVKFKRRFLDKLLDALTVQQNIAVNTSAEALDKAWFSALNKMVQFHYIYRTKGNSPLLFSLLDDIEKIGKQFEIYTMLVETLRAKKYIIGFKKGNKYVEAINKQIAHYQYCEQAKHKANDYYLRYTSDEEFKKNKSEAQQLKFLRNCIHELNKDIEWSQSAGVMYYTKLLEMAYYDKLKKYETAKKTTEELLQLVIEQPAVTRKQRVGNAYINAAYFDTLLNSFDTAIKNAKLALNYAPEKSNNFLLWTEYLFYIHYYKGDLHECNKLTARLLKADKTIHGGHRVDKYKYLNGCLLFKQKDFKKSLKQLNEKLEIRADKDGWDIYLRVLIIQCYIELNDLDRAATLTSDLEKQLQRLKPTTEINKRLDLICKSLFRLQTIGYRFNQYDDKLTRYLFELNDNSSAQSYKLFTPELIRFHNWLANKCKISLTREKVQAVLN